MPRSFRRRDTFSAVHEPLLGTRIEIAVESSERGHSERVGDLLAWEIARLEAMFSIFDPASELCRWRDGRLERPLSAEVAGLLATAAEWTDLTGGVFNPAAGELRRLWTIAEAEGVPPTEAALEKAAAQAPSLPYRVDGSDIERVLPCEGVDLNAIAKGHIVDLAVRSATADAVGVPTAGDIDRIVINAGGDVVHWGSGHLRVGIENPLRPYDNEPPLAVVDIAGEGLATSGSARRWFDVGGTRYSRVIDPRSGQPAGEIASASVVAPTATVADVVATAATVLPVEETLRLVEGLGDVDCLVVDRDGEVVRSAGWVRRERATDRLR